MSNKVICRVMLGAVAVCIMAATWVCCEENTTEPSVPAKRLTRAIRYYEDGSIKSVTVTYPDGTTVKKLYGISGLMEKKIAADGTEVTYTFSSDDGIKEAQETHTETTITRRFDAQGNIVMSKYMDRMEKYTYEKDKYGDIQSVTIEYDNDSKVTVPPTDKRLSFLWDYDIIGADDIPIYQNMEEKEYLLIPSVTKNEWKCINHIGSFNIYGNRSERGSVQ